MMGRITDYGWFNWCDTCDHGYLHGEWLLFYVGKRALTEERAEDIAFEDAQRIAETYWRQ